MARAGETWAQALRLRQRITVDVEWDADLASGTLAVAGPKCLYVFEYAKVPVALAAQLLDRPLSCAGGASHIIARFK